MTKHFRLFGLVLSWVIVLLLPAQYTNGQQAACVPPINVKLNVHKLKLGDVFDSISKQTGFYFSFNPQVVHPDKLISVSVDDVLPNVLKQLLMPDSLNYKLVNKHILIFKTKANVFQRNDIKVIKGKVIDNDNNQPLAFANVALQGSTMGTVCNEQGEYLLKLPDSLCYRKLNISFIGYEPAIVKVDTAMALVKLHSMPNLIPEVVVEAVDAKLIVYSAFEKVAQNYEKQSIGMTGFYREISKRNQAYVCVGEAVVNIQRAAGFNQYRGDRIFLLKGRKSPYVRPQDTVYYKFQGGITGCLMLDVIKNQPSFALPEFEQCYTYKLEGITSNNGRNMYQISFDQRDQIASAYYKGTIYIDINTLAVCAVDFCISSKGLKYADYLVRRSPLKFSVQPQKVEYHVDYRQVNQKWYLNYARCETGFFIRKRNHLFRNLFSTTAEMVITSMDTLRHAPIMEGIVVRPSTILDEYSEPYDVDFWGEQNIIKPEEPIEKVLKTIKPKLAVGQTP
jgi:hypothetical protein